MDLAQSARRSSLWHFLLLHDIGMLAEERHESGRSLEPKVSLRRVRRWEVVYSHVVNQLSLAADNCTLRSCVLCGRNILAYVASDGAGCVYITGHSSGRRVARRIKREV